MGSGRPRLPLGTYGDIWIGEQPHSTKKRPRYIARAQFRGADGRARKITRTGQSKAAAERALRTALAEQKDAYTAAIINTGTTVEQLAETWLNENRDRWATNTVERYELAVRKQIIPRLGAVRVSELRRSVVATALEAFATEHGPGAAKSAKACLHGMTRLAMRHDALTANPVADISNAPAPAREKVRALTVAETEDLCDRLRSDAAAVAWDLPDLVEWMLGTGARIGEACATRAAVFDQEAATWEINATLVRVKAVGMVVQERPKTAAGWRVLALPSQCVQIVQRRRSEERVEMGAIRLMGADKSIRLLPEPGIVFTSPGGSLRDPSNTAADLRHVLDALGYDWVTSHVFRKTVATRLDEAGCSARMIADQLGHSKPSMTLDTYMGRNVVSAEASRILER